MGSCCLLAGNESISPLVITPARQSRVSVLASARLQPHGAAEIHRTDFWHFCKIKAFVLFTSGDKRSEGSLLSVHLKVI